LKDNTMTYRIERDDARKRRSLGEHSYRIYDGDRLVARYWHDHRGDEPGREFVAGRTEGWPVGRMTYFIEGGGAEPLRLADRADAYLSERRA